MWRYSTWWCEKCRKIVQWKYPKENEWIIWSNRQCNQDIFAGNLHNISLVIKWFLSLPYYNTKILHYSQQLEKINESLKKYTVKSAACKLEEIKSHTCGSLMVFENQLNAYLGEIHKYQADLDFVSRFLGPLADDAWTAAQTSFKNKISSLIQDCANRQRSELLKDRYEIVSSKQ